MTHINKHHEVQPEIEEKKVIEKYIALEQQMDAIVDKLQCPGDYTGSQYHNLLSELNSLEIRCYHLKRKVVYTFMSVARLRKVCKRFYPTLDIKPLISEFSGGF